MNTLRQLFKVLVRAPFAAGVFVMAMTTIPCFAFNNAAAEKSLMQGRVDEAIATLQASPKDAGAQLLLCRAYYSVHMVDPAVAACEAAVRGLSSSSAARDWMGRAYGAKAEHAGVLTEMKLAGKVRSAFEAAVNLDTKSEAAANDLSEYYIRAPGIAGGGDDKAEELANRVPPQSAHRIRALLAEKHKDAATAEREFEAAAAVSNHADAWVDLGHYYSRHNQPDKAEEALKHAVAADPTMDASVVDVASILTAMHRDPEFAQSLLRGYLSKGAMSDAAPAFAVHTQLGQLLLAKGDKAGAKIEFGKALELAHGYGPAQKAMQGL